MLYTVANVFFDGLLCPYFSIRISPPDTMLVGA